MERGYKTKADNKACELREKLGLRHTDPLPGRVLARFLDVLVTIPPNIPGLNEEMLAEISKDGDEFSAITFVGPNDKNIIIHNQQHLKSRQESNIMHEMAHIIEKHPPSALRSVGGFAIRTYNEEHEEQAGYLGGALQIPRKAILWALKKGMTPEAIALYYSASLDMVRYRRNVTGVDFQLRHTRSYRYPGLETRG